MTYSTCKICLSEKRKIKFVSLGGISICQWCINELSAEHYTLEKVDNEIRKLAIKVCNKPLLPTEPSRINENELDLHANKIINQKLGGWPEPPHHGFNPYLARSNAIDTIKSKESALGTIFNSIFCAKNRESEIEELVDLQKEEYEQEYCQRNTAYTDALESYEISFENLKNDFLAKVYLKYNSMIDHYNADLQKYHQALKTEKEKAYSSIIVTNKFNNRIRPIYIKLLRAYRLNIISSKKEKRDNSLSSNYSSPEFCSQCKRKEYENHFHHIIPINCYGSNNSNNIVFLCYSCHNKQHEGFTVTRNKKKRTQRTGSEFVTIDIETTGFSYKNNDKIIEIAALHVKDLTVVKTFNTLIDPSREIPTKITNITGISNDMLSNAPVLDDVVDDFFDFLSDHKLVAHNSTFDINFINYYSGYFGYEIENEVIDTLKLSRKYLPDLHNHKLRTLIRYFDISNEQTHRALDDCVATSLIYINLLRSRQRGYKEYLTKLIT